IITKDLNANTITHFLDTGLGKIKRIIADLESEFPNAEFQARTVAIVSAIGSDMKISGMLSRTVRALADAGVDVLAIHQSMRQVDIQFVIDESADETPIRSLHAELIDAELPQPEEIAASTLPLESEVPLGDAAWLHRLPTNILYGPTTGSTALRCWASFC